MTAASSPHPWRVLVLGDTRDIHHHGCEAVLGQLIQGLTDSGIAPTEIITSIDWSVNPEVCLSADLVVINGEGGLHHNRPMVHRVLELGERRQALKRPTALVNTSWFENDASATRRLCHFDLLALRDPLSRAEAASHGIACLDAPDLAIREACCHQDFTTRQPAECRFMASDSTDTVTTKQLRAFAQRHRWDYLPVLYPPRQPRPGAKSRKIWKKLKLARALGPLARHLMSPRYHAHLVGAPDLASYKDALAHSAGVLTGRFHTACFCIGLGVPFLAVGSNTSKIQSLLLDANLDPAQRMIPLAGLDQAFTIPPFSPEEHQALAKFREESEIRFQTLFTAIRDLLPAQA